MGKKINSIVFIVLCTFNITFCSQESPHSINTYNRLLTPIKSGRIRNLEQTLQTISKKRLKTLTPEQRLELLLSCVRAGNFKSLQLLFEFNVFKASDSQKVLEYAQERAKYNVSNKRILTYLEKKAETYQQKKAKNKMKRIREKHKSAIKFALSSQKRKNDDNDNTEEIRRHKKLKLEEEEEPTCCICLDRLDSTKEAKKCNICNNITHTECLTEWHTSSRKNTCPLCRRDPEGNSQTDTTPPDWPDYLSADLIRQILREEEEEFMAYEERL